MVETTRVSALTPGASFDTLHLVVGSPVPPSGNLPPATLAFRQGTDYILSLSI
jgi:hypothetical protein